jgi:hypothetical protein
MIAFFLVAFGLILLFMAAIEAAARMIDRYADWKDGDTLRREERRERVRRMRDEREYREWLVS